ncbi:MAG: hypothetical protein ACO23H_19315, partial [Alphaproteobacteria bacterium]
MTICKQAPNGGGYSGYVTRATNTSSQKMGVNDVTSRGAKESQSAGAPLHAKYNKQGGGGQQAPTGGMETYSGREEKAEYSN